MRSHLSAEEIYKIYRETPEQGSSNYLYDHYILGLAGIMEPEAGRVFASAAWKAGRDTARSSERKDNA